MAADLPALHACLATPDISDIQDEFLLKVHGKAQNLKTPTLGLGGLMVSESGMSAAARNPGGAVGLIQFDVWAPDHELIMPGTKQHMTGAQVVALGDDGQLDYVEAFFHPYVGRLSTGGHLYAYCFIPTSANNPHYGPNFVICGTRPGDPFPNFQRLNSGFDRGHKGYTTGQDMEDAIARAWATPRGKLIRARFEALIPGVM